MEERGPRLVLLLLLMRWWRGSDTRRRRPLSLQHNDMPFSPLNRPLGRIYKLL